jgi:hypothetical protein
MTYQNISLINGKKSIGNQTLSNYLSCYTFYYPPCLQLPVPMKIGKGEKELSVVNKLIIKQYLFAVTF